MSLAAIAAAAGIVCLLASPPGVLGGVTGSPHDFSSSGPSTQSTAIAPEGVCSACHIPHGARNITLNNGEWINMWPRDLDLNNNGYKNKLTVDGVRSTRGINYVPGRTIACYDCHDRHDGTMDSGASGDPSLTLFNSSHRPQNIASGFVRNNPPGTYNTNNMTEDNWKGSVSGYYENKPVDNTSTYGANLALDPSVDNQLKTTGGHYLKNIPLGVPSDRFKRGDKLPCLDCHDPHKYASDWQAFIRSDLGGPGRGITAPVVASSRMANQFEASPRTAGSGAGSNDGQSRKICTTCHAYSNSGTPVSFNAINPLYSAGWGTIARPPATVNEHDSTNYAACVSCHTHNSVRISCDDCHGNPPPAYPSGLAAPTAYPPSMDSHNKHKSPYSYGCSVCHSQNNHNDNVVQVQFDNAFLGGLLASGLDNGIPSGGGTSCWNLYCHSSGRIGITPASAPTHYATVRWGVQTGAVYCNSCHGAFPNDGTNGDFLADNSSRRYGAPNYKNTGAGTNNANSHKAHVSKYDCYICHYLTVKTAYSATPPFLAIDNAAAHVDGFREVSFAGPAAGGSYNSSNRSCSVSACHGASVPVWGETIVNCGSCHFGTGDVNNFSAVDNTISVIDNTEWTAAGHGRTTAFPSGNPAASFAGPATDPNGCAYCHDGTVAHGDSLNPFRLKNKLTSAAADNGWNNTCMVCHKTGDAGYNPGTGYVLINATSNVDNNHYGAKHTGFPGKGGTFCWDCHDPHGDTNPFMIHSGDGSAPGKGVSDNTDGAFGIPGSSRPVTGFDVVTGGYTSADLANSSNTGLCQTCHAANGTSGGAAFYNRTLFTPLDSHNGAGGTRCTVCHTHQRQFGATCFSCHGNPATGQWWPDNAAVGASYPNRTGAHDNHVNTIGAWLYQETDATGLLSNTAKGDSGSKQRTICSWCHPNPGGPRPGTGELSHIDNGTPADIHGDGRSGATASYMQYFNGNVASPGSDNDVTATYNSATQSCSNLKCHNNVATPASWNTPPAWTTTGCAAAQCHATPAASGAHATHYTGKGYACSECHVVPTSLRHLDGRVSMLFGGLEATKGKGDGYYDKDISGTNSAGDNNFKAYDGNYARTCYNIYCHGADNAWGGTDTTPVWNDPNTANCTTGACHGVYGSAYTPSRGPEPQITTGNHPVHFKKYDNNANVITDIGPELDRHPSTGPSFSCGACHNITLTCGDCHLLHGQVGATKPTSTHVDGKIDFRGVGVWPPTYYDNGTTLAATDVCDRCHSTASVGGSVGTALAKANWGNTSYKIPCLNCHNSTYPAWDTAGGAGIRAPDEYGNGTDYGAETRGHNRASGSNYPGSGNPAANLLCSNCHNVSSLHINHVVDNTFAGIRLLDNVNGVSGITTVSGLCEACHTRGTLSSPATKKNINTHGNAGFPDRLEAVFAGKTCDQCHEPHGMVNVTAAPAGANIWMINPTIKVTSTDNVFPVRLFARTGANSFDNTGTASDLCRACHAHANNPGYPMTYNVAGQHAAPGYTGDERGKDCTGCHSHNQDDNTSTVDGLMPLPCNACHSYPGLDNSISVKQMSAGHAKHTGTPTDTTNTKGYGCTLCHYNYSHNENRVAKGAPWPANYYDNVNINFDPSWNPGSTTYRGLAVPTTGNGGSGICAGLYCHGGNPTLTAGWGGSDNTPVWNQPATGACGTCHDTGKGDTTPATVFSTKNHPVHIDNVAKPYGPGLAAFSAGGNCAEGTGCHPKYGLTPSSTHANNAKDLRSTPSDNGYVGATLAATQVCRNCHSTYTSTNIPVPGDNLVRTQANWDNPGYFVDCLTCHNGTAAGTQATANIDGSGGVAAAIEGTIYTMQHGIYGGGIGCGWCHGDLGHIGANRPVGSNPYRLDGYFFTGSYPPITTLGGIDYICGYCHAMFGAADHTWRVSGTGTYGPETKSATDTHPTTVQAVGTDKGRWYQLPASTHIPLYGDLMDNNYVESGGTNNYVLCVSCHDPHGVGTSPIPSSVRRFSGQNTDAKGNKALRFNYSSGTPTMLCSQCHK